MRVGIRGIAWAFAACCGICAASASGGRAQAADTLLPTGVYEEMNLPEQVSREAWRALPAGLQASWVLKDVHYSKYACPAIEPCDTMTLYAWRSERIHAEALLYTREKTEPLALRLFAGGEKPRRARRREPQGSARFLRYVATTDYKSCGYPSPDLPARLVPDAVDLPSALPLEAETVRPVWVTLEVPAACTPGRYAYTLEIADDASGRRLTTLHLTVEVSERRLPAPSEYRFHTDFWQQPYAVSRYYGVKPWSKAHFKALEPYMRLLARAGQKVASAILFYEPWGKQSNDKFQPMVETIRRADGTWRYDYSVFDRWVALLDRCGIRGQINCYSMIPWDMSFRYYDEASGAYKSLQTETSSPEYRELWTAFLTSFAAHLKKKRWFGRTNLAMDERGLQAMREAKAIADSTGWKGKIALAGNYYAELNDDIQDYCLAFGHRFPDEVLAKRRAEGKISTVYTCCTESQPNIFTNSQPAEAAYLPVFAIADGFDGYLHWSWLNWTDDPLRDSRFFMFAPGDTYVVYPGARSSVRHERFIEGVQIAEKIRLLREEYVQAGRTAEREALERVLQEFSQNLPVEGDSPARLLRKLAPLLR